MQNQLATPITSPSVELEITRHFQTYFVQVCELLIDSDPDELYSILDNNLTLIEQFISDQNVYTIFVQKIKSEDEELTDQENGNYSLIQFVSLQQNQKNKRQQKLYLNIFVL
jgi:hypothetical protein